MTALNIAESIQRTKLESRLKWYEEQIRARGKSFAAIFIELRNDPQQPWRLNHDTYEDYCREVWGMTSRRLQQIAAGASVKALLASEAPDLAPVVQAMREGQMRVLVTTPSEKRVEVLRAALEISKPGEMTAAKIKKAKARVIDAAPADPVIDDPAPAANVCPHCQGTGRIE